MSDIHRTDQKLERIHQKIDESNIDELSKKALKEFDRDCTASGLGKVRLAKYLYLLLRIRSMLGKSFSDATKKDIIVVVEQIERSKIEAWTKHDYKVTLKKFYKWLRGVEHPGAYPPEVDWITTTMRNSDHVLPEEILTQDEIRRMVEVASNLKEKAMISVLYESGCRAGEFLSLKIKNVQLDDFGAVLITEGKTGGRRVRIVASAPTLAMWLDSHPLKNDPAAPLWVSSATNRKNRPLEYRGFVKALEKIAEDAEVKKRVNPHSFRHARATHLANSLTEAQMKELFGWTQGSKMASIYVHLSGRDVDNALLQLYGLKIPENRTVNAKDMMKTCPRCNERNAWDSKFCRRCAMVLDVDTARQMERAEDIVSRLLEDPQTKKMLVQRLYELGQITTG
jgi:integrase/recombinase XerD